MAQGDPTKSKRKKPTLRNVSASGGSTQTASGSFGLLAPKVEPPRTAGLLGPSVAVADSGFGFDREPGSRVGSANSKLSAGPTRARRGSAAAPSVGAFESPTETARRPIPDQVEATQGEITRLEERLPKIKVRLMNLDLDRDDIIDSLTGLTGVLDDSNIKIKDLTQEQLRLLREGFVKAGLNAGVDLVRGGLPFETVTGLVETGFDIGRLVIDERKIQKRIDDNVKSFEFEIGRHNQVKAEISDLLDEREKIQARLQELRGR